MEHLYDELKAAGVPMDSHESDLYVKVCPESWAIIRRHLEARTLGSAPCFVSRTDRAMWFDLAFQYLPWWEQRQASARGRA